MKRLINREKLMKKGKWLLVAVLCLMLAGCSEQDPEEPSIISQPISEEATSVAKSSAESSSEESAVSSEDIEDLGIEETSEEEVQSSQIPETSEEPQQSSEAVQVTPQPIHTGGKLIVIDAGHQKTGNYDQEPDGPGSTTMKTKVSAGTKGKFTGLAEYELTLIVAKKLQAILIDRGYDVIMVRETNDVDISNSERAAIANNANADAFIRIHANGCDIESVNGAETLCQTKNNPYNASLYQLSRALSEAVLDGVIAECKCNRRNIFETDTMSGINWCQVPVTIVEMGYMSNEKEDRLMATEEYQDKLALGIANGIDTYFAGR